jgi:ABC-2 type transport system ATP-binding protein
MSIEVSNLRVRYGDVEAVRGISFSVPSGQICGYLGPNGAGKSSTLKILSGILEPTDGIVRIAGHVMPADRLEAQRSLGYVPENAAAYSLLTPSEYLELVSELFELPRDGAAEKRRTLLERFGLAEEQHRAIATLSKGQRQKVVLLSALLHDPTVLLLDEPLSGLDANAARTVKEIVQGLAARGTTVLFSSHRLELVERLCERVIILHRGEVVADAATSELVSLSRGRTLEKVFAELTSGEGDVATRDILDALKPPEPQAVGAKGPRK